MRPFLSIPLHICLLFLNILYSPAMLFTWDYAIYWMLLSPTLQNSHVEILVPSVIVLGGGAFRRWLGHKAGTLMNRISALIENFFPILSCEDTARKIAAYEPRSKLSSETECAVTLTLDFPVSVYKKQILVLYKPRSLLYFCYRLNRLRQTKFHL